jgi:hypothetical protein
MLVIRKEQIEVLRQPLLQEFEDKTYVRLLAYKPGECASLGEAAVRLSIRQGMQKAMACGISREVDIARYINIMYTLGHDFDADPRYPWAAEILNDGTLKGESKVQQLCDLTAITLAVEERAKGETAG